MTTAAFDRSLLHPPPSYQAAPEVELSANSLAKLQQITKHFSSPDLELRADETSTERRKLDQREMMFLVSLLTMTRAMLTAIVERDFLEVSEHGHACSLPDNRFLTGQLPSS